MTTPNYNTDNYSISELLSILELDDPTADEITTTTNNKIKQFAQKDPQLSNFFKDIQSKLLNYMNKLEEKEENTDQEVYKLNQNNIIGYRC